MFKERDQRSTNTHNLMRRNIHVIDRLGRRENKTRVISAGYTLTNKFLCISQGSICLSNHIFIFSICGEVIKLIRDIRHNSHGRADLGNLLHDLRIDQLAGFVQNFFCLRVNHVLTERASFKTLIVGFHLPKDLAIRRFNEAVFIHTGKRSETTDQTNVRTFWRFNWTNTTIM